MGISTGRGYCPHCRRHGMVACSATAVWLQLALTLATAGLWGFVWLYVLLWAPVCACCRCGRKLPRTCRAPTAPSWPAGFRPLDPIAGSRSEFNRILVARNLVYYVPTSARYGRT